MATVITPLKDHPPASETPAVPPSATPQSAPPQEETDARAAVLALMMEMQRGMMSRLDGRAAREWLKLELTTAQLKLLMWLVGVREQPMSQLARVLGIGLPAATNLVDKLVDAGLVTREHSPVDRRVVLVRPSPEGEVQITRLRQVGRDQMRRILAHVPDDDLPTLAAGTRIILEAARRAAAAAQHHTAELDAPR